MKLQTTQDAYIGNIPQVNGIMKHLDTHYLTDTFNKLDEFISFCILEPL